jgi:RND family efflux transporter MFP subunit
MAQKTEAEKHVAGARQRLRVREVADVDMDSIVANEKTPDSTPIRSPSSGEVMEKMVVNGSEVTAGSKIMRIEGHSQLWLDAQVYENQIPAIQLGQTVKATLRALPGKTVTGKVTFIDPHVDDVMRTETVRAQLDNPDQILKPGMYASVSILTKPVADALLVPREAVIDTGARQIAFVALPEGHFESRQVHVGLKGDDDQLQILDGLSEGEQVVTSGQFLLDVESRTVEAIDKLSKPSGGMR